MPKVSIIILTYNSSSYILGLLRSIKTANPDNSYYEVIVVDNSSADDTVSQVSSIKYQVLSIKLIENEKNLGFAAGINRGVKGAKGDYLLFINPDTKFEKGNILDLVSVFDKFENIGIVGGKLFDKNGKSEKSAGRFFGLFEILLIALGLDEAFGARTSPTTIKKVDFVSGGFMMVKKDVFEKLNGFDENFFMYVEDLDFCKRAKKLGYQTYFTPEVSLLHHSHGSSSRAFAIENIYKGILYYSKKHSNTLSYNLARMILKTKAVLIVIISAIINNSSLRQTYSKALKA